MSKAPALSKSPHQIHEKASTAGKEGTKERKSRAGTRSVTTLSTQQLIRKRANDREAQRAIRQRTKDHIDNLERRIAQLSSKDEKLNNALQRNAALEAEVANLRNQFYAGGTANVLGYNYGDEESSSPKSVTSTLSNGRLVGDLPLAQVDPLSGFTNQGSSVPVDSMGVAPQSNMIPPTGVMSGLDLTAAIPVLPTAPSSTSTSATFSQSEPWQDYPALARSNTSVSSPSSDDYSTDQGSWAPDEGMNAAAMTTGAIPGVESALPPSINFNFMIDANGRPITFYSNAINAPYSNEQMNQGDIQSQFPASTSLPQQQNMPLAAENPFISSPATTVDGIPIIPRHGPPIDVNTIVNPPPTLVNFLNQPSTYAWEIPIRTVQPTCDVDVILLTFMHKQRGLMIEGVPRLQIEGPKYPSITSLLNPRRGETSHPISKVLTDLLSSLPSLVSVPEKTATLFMMYLLLRWQCSPNPSTYDSIPSWLTPRPAQLLTPHPIWIDQMPWPKLRDRVIAEQATYATLEFQVIFTSSLSVNWPYDPMYALSWQGDEVVMNPVFERWVNKLENWSLGKDFQNRYPELEDVCKFSGKESAAAAGL